VTDNSNFLTRLEGGDEVVDDGLVHLVTKVHVVEVPKLAFAGSSPVTRSSSNCRTVFEGLSQTSRCPWQYLLFESVLRVADHYSS
jgi:hypothetical protein